MRRVSIEYFDEEPREALSVDDEQRGILAGPKSDTASRKGSAADKLVRKKAGGNAR